MVTYSAISHLFTPSPPHLPQAPTSASLGHALNKLLAFEPLSQGLFLGEVNSRQVDSWQGWSPWGTSAIFSLPAQPRLSIPGVVSVVFSEVPLKFSFEIPPALTIGFLVRNGAA